jgi:Ca2+-binding EF-hand superfamily protein
MKNTDHQRRKVYEQVENLGRSIGTLLEAHFTMVSEASDVYGLLGCINTIHNLYEIKKYSPPEDIEVGKLTFPPLSLRDITASPAIKRVFDPSFLAETELLNEIFGNLKKVFLEETTVKKQTDSMNQIQNELLGMEFQDLLTQTQHEEFKNIIEKKVSILGRVNNKESEKIGLIEKAISLFREVYKEGSEGIDSSDLCWCLNQLGFSIDENMISFASPDGSISFEDYLSIVKETYKMSFDSIELKKAFRVFSLGGDVLDLRKLDISDRDFRNILHLNRNNPSLSINEFFENFIEK